MSKVLTKVAKVYVGSTVLLWAYVGTGLYFCLPGKTKAEAIEGFQECLTHATYGWKTMLKEGIKVRVNKG